MNVFEIIAAMIFYLALNSWGLFLEQEKTPIEEKIGMFRSSVVTILVSILSFILIIASGIILFLYSWKILIIIFIISGLLYPFIGRWIVLRLWLIPIYFLERWAEKKLKNK